MASGTGSALYELLATVYVERSAGDCGVRLQMDSECGDVRWTDDAPDRDGGAELLPPGLDVVAEERRRKRCVHEARRDEVDADGRQLKRQVPGQRGECGRQRGDQGQTHIRSPATGATH